MEPDRKYYEPFIKPLLHGQDSTYKHTKLSGGHPTEYWSTYNKIFNDELLPKREPLESNDARLRQNDTSLLFTGNLYRKYADTKQTENAVQYSTMIFNHMAQAAQANNMFHAFGLVRMLFWVPEDTMYRVHATRLSERKGLNLPLELSVDTIKITGTDEILTHPKSRQSTGLPRPSRIEDKSSDRTVKEMHEHQIEIPADRQCEGHKSALERRHMSITHGDSDARNPSLSELDDAILFIGRELDIIAKLTGTYKAMRVPLTKKKAYPTPYALPKDMSPVLLQSHKNRAGPFVDLTFRQRQAEMDYALLAPTLKESDRECRKESLLKTAAQLRTLMATVFEPLRRLAVSDYIEEMIGLEYNPPLIPHDRRPYESLVARAQEFYPAQLLCLIDAFPRSQNLASDITSAVEGNQVSRDLAKHLMAKSRNSLPEALDRIAPNAARDLIAATPILRDPLRGGRLDPKDLPVRMLTRDMFHALVVSFLEWPFRPSTAELADTGEAQSDHVDEEDDDEPVE